MMNVAVLMLTVSESLSPAIRPTTRITYLMACRAYLVWCKRHRLKPFPATPEVFASYIGGLFRANYKRSTIQLRIAALAHVHRCLGHSEPNRSTAFRKVWIGIKRSKPSDRKSRRPLTIATLRLLLESIPHDLRGLRDRAIILVGFAGALMCNEIQQLDREKITFDEAMLIDVGEPRERRVYIGAGLHPSTCPVLAMRAWLEIANIRTGPVFREINVHGNMYSNRLSKSAIGYILQKRCAAAGLRAEYYGMQSLRSGFYLSANENNIDADVIAKHAGIHGIDGLKRRYLDPANRWSVDLRSIDEPLPSRKIRRHD